MAIKLCILCGEPGRLYLRPQDIKPRQAKYCESCDSKYKSKYRIKKFIAGLCQECGNNPIADNKKHCQRCLDTSNLLQQKNREERKSKLILLLGNKCADCGLSSDCSNIYDFHHTNPSKKENYFTKLFNLTWEKIIKEASTGVALLCSNCHRIRHAKEYESKNNFDEDLKGRGKVEGQTIGNVQEQLIIGGVKYCAFCRIKPARSYPHPRWKNTLTQGTYCEEHGATGNDWKTWKNRNERIGMCGYCGKVPPDDNRNFCRKCLDYANTGRKIRRNKKKKEIIDKFFNGGCFDCGLKSNYTEIYDFHHLDPSTKEKQFNLLLACSWKSVQKELDKGVVVICSVCHRRRHEREHEKTFLLLEERVNGYSN